MAALGSDFGEDVRLGDARRLRRIELEGKLLQLCAFTTDEAVGPLARPIRRR